MSKRVKRHGDWWQQGRPYSCGQCGKLCYQGLMHKCAKALPMESVPVHHAGRINAATEHFAQRLNDGFNFHSSGD